MSATVICVAGPSGSGKSTATEEIVAHYGKEKCLVISIDNYYKDLSHVPDAAERAKTNFDHTDSIDAALLLKHTHDLRNGLTVHAPEWDFVTHTRKSTTREINPEGKEYIIIEGIFALNKWFEFIGDVNVYIDTDPVLCALRRAFRDTRERGRTLESVLEQYEKTVLPMQKIYVEPTKQFANVILVDSKNIRPIVNFITDMTKDDLTVIKETFSSVKTSVAGFFNGWLGYAGQSLERADYAAHDFLLADAHPDVKISGGPK